MEYKYIEILLIYFNQLDDIIKQEQNLTKHRLARKNKIDEDFQNQVFILIILVI